MTTPQDPGATDRDETVERRPGQDVPALVPSDTALLETLVLEAPVAFAFYDTELRYRRINRMLADINGLPMAEHIGRRPAEVLPSPLGEAVEARLLEVYETGRVIADPDFRAILPATGELRHYESQWFPATGPEGSVIGVAVLVIDVTERRRNEDALRRSTERTAALQRATAALAEALTVDDVRAAVRRLDTTSLGGLDTELVLDTSNGSRMAAPGVPDDDALVISVPLVMSGATIGMLRVRTTGSSHLARSADATGATLATDESGLGDPEDRRYLEALAGQCAIALSRARLFEKERRTAVVLQRSLLPDRLPEVPGLTLAAHFSPGSPGAEVGGDWYDAFTLPDGRLVLVVGDVMGKGIPAAAGMGRLRSALRALAHADPLPGAVLQGLDRVFTATEGSDHIATLVYLLINPAAHRAAIGATGHLPIVLRRAGQEPELIEAAAGSTPLGWPEPRVQRTLELGPGDLVMGFTDGLVERRGRDIDETMEELRVLVRDPDEDLAALVDRVSAVLMANTRGRDDATLLALRFAG